MTCALEAHDLARCAAAQILREPEADAIAAHSVGGIAHRDRTERCKIGGVPERQGRAGDHNAAGQNTLAIEGDSKGLAQAIAGERGQHRAITTHHIELVV